MPYLRADFSASESEELEATGGNAERLLAFLEERYRLTRREAEARLGEWLERFRGR